MTELEVKENKFYVLTVAEEKGRKATLHNELGSAINRVREHLKAGIGTDDVELMAVEMKEEKFEIKGVPWSTIALGLVKE